MVLAFVSRKSWLSFHFRPLFAYFELGSITIYMGVFSTCKCDIFRLDLRKHVHSHTTYDLKLPFLGHFYK